MRTFLRNLSFGVRMLAKSPGFAVLTVLTLAIGIGANTAIFTVTNALLLRPFPYRDPTQLVTVAAKDATRESDTTLLRYELVRDLSHSFQTVAVWTNDNLNLTGTGDPLQVPVERVSPSFFSMLGIQPQLGRAFIAEEGTPEGKPVVILSDAMWRTRFQGDPAIIGRTVLLDSTANTVVGVLPSNVQFPFAGPADIFTPRYFEFSLMTPQRLRMGVGYLNMLARLREGTTLLQANTELAMLNQRYREQNPTAPDAGAALVMTAAPLRELVVGNVRGKLLMLSAAVGLVLLIACANMASLLLSRAVGRKREIAVRAAMGASRASLIGQLMTESLMLALTAGVLGAGLGWAAVRALAVWGTTQLPQGIPIGVDLRVLLFTVGVSVGSGVLFGMAPAVQLSRVDLNAALREEGRSASTGRSHSRLKNMLVVGQVALSLLLLIGAGLLLRSFVQLLRIDPGFELHNVLTMEISLSAVKYAKADQQIAFFDDLMRRVSAIPGVRHAAISAALPLTAKRITPVLPEGQPDAALAQRPFIDIEAISPQWFQTLMVPIRSGREFSPGDKTDAPPVVIVNETFARQYWPNESALNKRVVIGRRPNAALVVGVAGDIRNKGLEQEPQPQIYIPFPQLAWGDMNLLVRTDVPPLSLIPAVRAQISAIDADQPATNIQTVDDLVDSSRAQPQFTMALVAVFAATALMLAIIGVYGVLSYSVAQRQQEIGIRLALGADREDVLSLVLRQGLTLAATGIAVGLATALLLTHLVASMLYKVSPHDVATFVVAPALFLCVALLASYLPARRATRVNPIEALR